MHERVLKPGNESELLHFWFSRQVFWIGFRLNALKWGLWFRQYTRQDIKHITNTVISFYLFEKGTHLWQVAKQDYRGYSGSSGNMILGKDWKSWSSVVVMLRSCDCVMEFAYRPCISGGICEESMIWIKHLSVTELIFFNNPKVEGTRVRLTSTPTKKSHPYSAPYVLTDRDRDSPGVTESLLTGEALSRVFLHQTADEVLGWRKNTQDIQ